MKKCKCCGVLKAVTEFSLHKGCSDGVRPECKTCYNFARKADKNAFIIKMFRTQCTSSAKRGHPAPAYTESQFKDWVLSQPNFLQIWNAYQASGQMKDLAPSADRSNPNLPYTLGNLELVTWGVNNQRGTNSSFSGERVSQHRSVLGIGPMGNIGPFVSLHEAARAVNGNPTNIQRVADKKILTKPDGRTTILKTHKGYSWVWS